MPSNVVRGRREGPVTRGGGAPPGEPLHPTPVSLQLNIMNIIGVKKGAKGQVSRRFDEGFSVNRAARRADTKVLGSKRRTGGITLTWEVSWQTSASFRASDGGARDVMSGCPIGPEPFPERPR